MRLAGGKSRFAQYRRQRAVALGRLMAAGSSEAAFRLLKRRFALAWVAKYGSANIPLMVAACKAKRERLQREQEAKQRQEQAQYARMAKEYDQQMALDSRSRAIVDREQQERQYWAQHNRAQKPATTQTQQQQRAKQQQDRVAAQIAREAEERARYSRQRPH